MIGCVWLLVMLLTMSTSICALYSAGIIEKDSVGDVLWTWAYPSVSTVQRDYLCRKCCLQKGEQTDMVEFVYSQFQGNWYYIFTTDVQEAILAKVSHFSLVLSSKDFHPEKYQALCRLLSKLYKKTGSPAALLESYLSVATKGVCNGEENGAFAVKEFDNKAAYIGGSIKDVINRFQIEIILLYTAILLKKRVAVYHSVVEELLQLMRVLPVLVWHRQNWSMLYPWVHLEALELQNLKKASYYVAGFTDATVESRSDLYDLFVNASASEVSIASHAKETFAMGKLHKDLAVHIVQSADNEENTEQKVIQEIAKKTKELLTNLQSLATDEEDGNRYITIETLKSRKMQPATENFLLNLAAAEGVLKT